MAQYVAHVPCTRIGNWFKATMDFNCLSGYQDAAEALYLGKFVH